MRIGSIVVMMCAGLLACGGGKSGGDADTGCTTGVACGSGCCANPTQVCMIDSTGSTCVAGCTRASDCSTGCCAPLADSSGNLSGPYACQDTSQCCAIGCAGTTCCVTDENANTFCAEPCTGSGAGTCGGSATCNSYLFSDSTCTGSLACGPVIQ